MKRINIAQIASIVLIIFSINACKKDQTLTPEIINSDLKATYVPATSIRIATPGRTGIYINKGTNTISVTQAPTNADPNYILTIVSGGDCATLSNNIITAKKNGVFVIKASTKSGSDWDSCAVIIKNQVVTTISPITPVTIPGMVTYNWDNATFPQSAWQDNANIPNTGGFPSGTGHIWRTAVEYTNKINTVSTAIQRQPGHPSIHMICNPNTPAIPTAANPSPSNFRSEIFLSPFHELIPVPSEQWISWSYYFPTDNSFFDASSNGEGAIHQLHASNNSPVCELWHHGGWGNNLIVTNRFGDGKNQSEVAFNTHYRIGSGHWVDFIEHVQWSTTSTGLYELWIIENGATTKVRTYNGPNTFSNPEDGNAPYGGTPKLGFYHFAWHGYGDTSSDNNAIANVKAYQATGGAQLESYIGPVRIYNRPAGQYDANGYKYVNPGSY